MKKISLLSLTIALPLLIASCGNGSSGGNSADVAPSAGVSAGKVSLTHEDAIVLSGYINCESNHITGISREGAVRGFNNSGEVSDEYLDRYGVERNGLIKYIAADYDDDFLVLDKNGNTGRIKTIDDDFTFQNVKDIFYTNSNSGDDYLTVIFKDGSVWSSSDDIDPQSRLSGYDDVVYGGGSGAASGLIFTHADGTVSIEPIRNIWNKDRELDSEKLQSEIASWTDMTMAVMGGGENAFAAGLRSDGTVIATGSYAEYTDDWKNIVYIEAANGVLAGLTSDGRVKVAGDNSENTKYRSIVTDKVTDPVEWENIVAISMNNDGAMIGLTVDGEIVGFCDGSDGETGIGPADL